MHGSKLGFLEEDDEKKPSDAEEALPDDDQDDVELLLGDDEVPLELVWCPAGAFTMGSPENELGRSDDETQHRVTLTKGFWIGAYPVTQAQYEAVMGKNPSDTEGDAHPVENVSWHEAVRFCKKLTAREHAAGRLPRGQAYTLPTEAQWEYACRAGTKTALNSGKNLTSEEDECPNLEALAWYGKSVDEEGEEILSTQPVGQKAPNAWGLYDMHGNVWEWCSDWYGAYPVEAVVDPVGASSGSNRVNRGGCWDHFARSCRSAYRYYNDPSDRSGSLGFRLARTLP